MPVTKLTPVEIERGRSPVAQLYPGEVVVDIGAARGGVGGAYIISETRKAA